MDAALVKKGCWVKDGLIFPFMVSHRFYNRIMGTSLKGRLPPRHRNGKQLLVERFKDVVEEYCHCPSHHY
jgi:hypothetical protein